MPDAFGNDGDARLHGRPARRAGLFDRECPLAVPQDDRDEHPADQPGLPARGSPRCSGAARGLVAGAILAVAAIAFVNLLHFSQGWVNFGYRFSNDFVVFALPLVALGMARRGRRRLAGRRAHRAVGRDQPVGRDLGQRPRMVSAAATRNGPRPPPAAFLDADRVAAWAFPALVGLG